MNWSITYYNARVRKEVLAMPEGIGRVFYCTQVGKSIVVLHSFVKKTQEPPDAELRLARKRLKDVQHG